jgi:small neutral amino acid transporter SnatA (MarC family)
LLFALIIGSGALIIGMNWNSITLYIQGGGSKSGTPVSSTEELAIGAFSASPETISPGQKSTLSWNTGGATSVSIDQGIGKVAAAGSSVVSPSDNITYTLTATGTSDSATASVTVSVVAVQTPIISSFTATPSGITAGQTSVLQWNVTGANSATIDQDIGDVPLEGPLEVSPSENTTYTLTATGTSDSATASVTVSVVAVQTPIISSFTATPSEITAGQTSVLQWNMTGANSATIDPDIGDIPLAGPLEVAPSETTTYTLTAQGETDTAATVTVTVSVVAVETPIISSFTATPAEITAGQTSVLQWNMTGANSATIDPDIGDVPLAGPLEVAPSETTTYTLTAQGETDTSAATVTVTVNPGE